MNHVFAGFYKEKSPNVPFPLVFGSRSGNFHGKNLFGYGSSVLGLCFEKRR